MGLIVKTKGDLYQLISSVSDERLHDEKWITEKDAKALLIEKAWWDFIKNSIEIYMDFPNGYGNHNRADRKGLEWLIANWNDEKIKQKFDEICKELEIEF